MKLFSILFCFVTNFSYICRKNKQIWVLKKS
uniref:Uncharacterized protein n=1 Tax=Siphoviridae sp. ctlIg4 TaxID=2825647 RepID=A0A8S5UAS0_9CAUD|nr:MAG TPA: hypothetical protein [Siphoviridae sp. ctlIg4]